MAVGSIASLATAASGFVNAASGPPPPGGPSVQTIEGDRIVTDAGGSDTGSRILESIFGDDEERINPGPQPAGQSGSGINSGALIALGIGALVGQVLI